MSDSSTRPPRMRAVHCTFIVSAALNRSVGSCAFHSMAETPGVPPVFTSRSAWPRRRCSVWYQPPGMDSRDSTAPSGMGAGDGIAKPARSRAPASRAA